MKEYEIENGRKVNLNKLRVKIASPHIWGEIHRDDVKACHDVFIELKGGILLVTRKRFPARGVLWPVGGGINRGMKIEDSLKKKTKEECGLILTDIKYIGHARTFFNTDPFGHDGGTDSINFVYFARGRGKLKLNKDHEKPLIVKQREYKKIKKKLHPYVRDFMDIVIRLVKK